jgi:phosphatidylserine decarboxylase
MSAMSRLDFFKRFLTSFHTLGAVTPSSKAVACALVDQVDLRKAKNVVELGPGTGVVTREILRRLPVGARLIAFEIDPYFVEYLRANIDDPRLTIVQGSAESLTSQLKSMSAYPADHVFSEIPFNNMPEELRREILTQVREVLDEDGSLVVLQYLPFAARRLLRQIFPCVRIASYVPWNVPPAFILTAGTVQLPGEAGREITPTRSPWLARLALLGVVVGLARVQPVLGAAAVAGTAGVLFFMRDPKRYVAAAAGEAMSPADGKVIGIETVHDSYWNEDMQEVRLFLSILDVHIQRSPLPGRVVHIEKTPGAKLPAMRADASIKNERNAIYLDGEDGHFVVTQVAGALARTIVCWVKPGQDVQTGDKLGMIKLGSQTSIRLPLSYRVDVRMGDTVRAGLDVIARRMVR